MNKAPAPHSKNPPKTAFGFQDNILMNKNGNHSCSATLAKVILALVEALGRYQVGADLSVPGGGLWMRGWGSSLAAGQRGDVVSRHLPHDRQDVCLD